MLCRATSTTSGPVIFAPFSSKKQFGSRSDRHLDDVLIGSDHLVTHSDDGLQRRFRFGHGGHDIDDAAVLGGGGHRHLVFACLAGIDGFADRLFEEIAETAASAADRSEEHTSELQSLMRISYAVFCLKKK